MFSVSLFSNRYSNVDRAFGYSDTRTHLLYKIIEYTEAVIYNILTMICLRYIEVFQPMEYILNGSTSRTKAKPKRQIAHIDVL